MIWPRQSTERQSAPEAGLPEHFAAFLSSALGYASARMELAGIEGKEAVGIYAKVFAMLALAIGLLLFGYIFLWIGVIVIIAQFFDYWGWITLGVGVAHVVGTLVFLALARSKWGEPVFTQTLQEFKKDQEWLNRTTARHNS